MKNINIHFEKYLLDKTRVSEKSLKHYRSDLSHFSAWFIFKIKTFGILAEEFKETIPFLNKDIAEEYKKFLISNKIAFKTINRRLSTLRHLARFLILNEILHFDFMENTTNIKKEKFMPEEKQIISEFSQYLTSEKISQNTSKNYISDIKQFLGWVEKNTNRQSVNIIQ